MRRSQSIRKSATSSDYVYLHESDFKIGQFTSPNSVDEAMSCPNSDRGFTTMQEELKAMHDNDVWDVKLPNDFKPMVVNGFLSPRGIQKATVYSLKLHLLTKFHSTRRS